MSHSALPRCECLWPSDAALKLMVETSAPLGGVGDIIFRFMCMEPILCVCVCVAVLHY